jgi:hypothetical protein
MRVGAEYSGRFATSNSFPNTSIAWFPSGELVAHGDLEVRSMRAFAIVLIVLGLVALGVGTISYTTHDKVLDLGPVEVTTQKKHSEHIPLAAGIGAVAAGAILLIAGRKAST